MIKVLYVEDERVIRDSIARLLELNGYEVAKAWNGRQGIEMTLEWKPDIILMDLRMPVMDGYDAISQIKSDYRTSHIPIFVISAWSTNRERSRAKKVGANNFFRKPPDMTLLIEAIEDAVAASRNNRSQKQTTYMLRPEREGHHQLSLEDVEVQYSERMELAFQLKLWQSSPELAATLEQFTQLTSGIIHDLRNRLGILQNYEYRAAYCLRLLDSLAFLRFKSSLSRGNDEDLSEQRIVWTDLMEFSFGDPKVTIHSLDERGNRAGDITVKGSVDFSMLSRGLWLFFHGIGGYFSTSNRSQDHIRSKALVIEIQNKCRNSTHWSCHISISISSKPEIFHLKPVNFQNVLLGEEMIICLFVLYKTVFLHNGTFSIKKPNNIEIKIPKSAFSENQLQALQKSIDKLARKISIAARHYDGPEPNIYPVIRGFVAAISRSLDDIVDETKNLSDNRIQEIIQRNCHYSQLLLQNLVWLGVGFELPKEEIDVGDTLQAVLEIMRSEIRESVGEDEDDFIEVKREFEPNLPPVLANRTSLQQVFMNLITNALETMPESGTLTLRTFQRAGEVYIEISDTGSGISPENMEHIFDLAFSTKQGHERGTGLHIVKAIIDKLGGRVEVESEIGAGTIFRVCLQSC